MARPIPCPAAVTRATCPWSRPFPFVVIAVLPLIGGLTCGRPPAGPPCSGQRRPACEGQARLGLDPDRLVPFRGAFGARHGADLELAASPSPSARWTMETSSVSPERAETMAPQPSAAAAARAAAVSLTVPAWFTLRSTALHAPAAAAAVTSLAFVTSAVVAHDLHVAPVGGGEGGEAREVILGQRVLDRDDGVVADEAADQVRRPRPRRARGFRARGGSARPCRTPTRRCRARGRPARRGVRRCGRWPRRAFRAPLRWCGSRATSRPRRPRPRSRPRADMMRAGGVVDLGGDVDGLGEARGAGDHDHEVLQVDAPAGMGAAAEDLDLGEREERRRPPGLGHMGPERAAGRRRGGVERGERDGDERVAAEPAPVRGAVERDERGVDRPPDRGRRGRGGRRRSRRPHARPRGARPARRAPRRRRGGPPPRGCRARRRRGRWRGRARRPTGALPPPRWASRGCPRRGGPMTSAMSVPLAVMRVLRAGVRGGRRGRGWCAGGSAIMGRAMARTVVLRRGREVFDGRFPVDAREHQRGEKCGDARFERRRVLPVDMGAVGGPEPRARCRRAGPARRGGGRT